MIKDSVTELVIVKGTAAEPLTSGPCGREHHWLFRGP
jgi:hypothetical protein